MMNQSADHALQEMIAAVTRRVLRALGLKEETDRYLATSWTPAEEAAISPETVAASIDHTLLKPDATPQQIARLCEEALEYRFAAVCVNPVWVDQCARALSGSPVQVASVVGFPLGATLPQVKAFEADEAVKAGATEIDMVINIGALKSGNVCLVWNDILGVAEVVHRQGGIVKVIIEMGYLTDEEKIAACVISRAGNADFVKTATGFGPSGATEEDIRLMRRVVGDALGVKAAGGVRTYDQARRMILAGANRIGTSSGVRIMREALAEESA
ncbi:MAG: deoxyribose-phosphate aldolase [Anaerolineae bacterium]